MTGPERILALTATGVVALLFVWYQGRLLLLAFAGFLLAILLHSAASWIEHHTPLNPVLAYTATLMTLTGIIAIAVLGLGPRFIAQLSQISAAIPPAFAQARVYLEQRTWGAAVLEVLHRALSGGNTGMGVTGIAKALLECVADLIVIFVIGFFGALNPRGYREGLLSLVPAAYRRRARTISKELVETLRWWLLGQMVPMVLLGIASMTALWLLGVHLAFTLGLLTGLMIFIPYVGLVLSGLPAILLAFQRGPLIALYVLILYSVFHLLEGYLLTPYVQKRAIRLPPVLTILSQILLWRWGGLLGVAVAGPLAATGLVLVKNLYLSSNSSSTPALPS